MKHVEHTEQVKFMQRVDHVQRDVLAYAIPNGGYRHPREAIRLKAEGVKSGIPDVMVARASGRYHGLYLEFKTAEGRPSAQQKDKIAKLESEGYKVDIVRSCEAAWDVFISYLNLEAA